MLKATHKLFDNFILDQKYEITNGRVGGPWKVTQNIRDNIELGFLIKFREFQLNFFAHVMGSGKFIYKNQIGIPNTHTKKHLFIFATIYTSKTKYTRGA